LLLSSFLLPIQLIFILPHRIVNCPSCVEFSRATSTFYLLSFSSPASKWDVTHTEHANRPTVTPMCRSSSPRLCAWPRRKCYYELRLNCYFYTHTVIANLCLDYSVRHRGPDWSESQFEAQTCASYLEVIELTRILRQAETSAPRAPVSCQSSTRHRR
jgi:hypothetical protein